MLKRPRAYARYEHHQLAAMFPLLKGQDFEDLVEDIRKHGLREPISLFEGKIIDGRNRERACIKAGVEPRYRSIELNNHDAAVAYVISKNIRRRHQTREQNRQLIEDCLRADPAKSDRQIARAVNVDNKTVGAVREKAEAREDIPRISKRTDSKGRSQFAHKATAHAPKKIKTTIELTEKCVDRVRQTIEGTIKKLQQITRRTAFDIMFMELAKVVEDLKRKTRNDAEKFRRKAQNNQVTRPVLE